MYKKFDKDILNKIVCAKTVWTTLDSLTNANLCYAGHFQATQDRTFSSHTGQEIFKPRRTFLEKQKYNKQNLF